ncbi:uncharacterized protein BX664DRAFT_314727 [Halteromyces radiatus]|uniref:uncharacterized protein n=1 Tax=Halteromyces radiatus TaxID=101107 RepID=UPI00221FA489|nr:uncharacterized protein BX664DRAFT_314727 [Halteromyces radiatus]KAI8089528.1 hypothetical protein BX664DRAFT_314727 [Halteromyces radiatus]
MNQSLAGPLLDQVISTIRQSKKLNYDQIRVLYNLVGTLLIEALNLIDTDSVIRLNCGKDGKRQIYQVLDTANTTRKDPQLCLLYPRHCSCDHFIRTIVCGQSSLMCRHILAAVLFDAMDDRKGTKVMDEEDFAKLLYTWNPRNI